MTGTLKHSMARGIRTRFGGVSFFGVAFWICSMYFVYLYASNQAVSKNMDPSSFQPRDIKMEAPPIPPAEYEYKKKLLSYDRDMPLIFIGGMPRSGTTLMRVMLDAHPDVRCGQETHITPVILGKVENWLTSPDKRIWLEEAGISREVMNTATAQFILEIIVNHGKPAPRLCSKDPIALKFTLYLNELFPNSKFILMLRDGRATAHSIISRKVNITGFDITSYRDVLTKWNRAIEVMVYECMKVGPNVCLGVHYEQLVLQPIKQAKKILEFLDIPWNDGVLNHEKHMSNISLSNVERSTDQVQRPLYLDALSSWFGHIPDDVMRDMGQIAPMLQRLGYNPNDPRPKYGEPDEWVLNKTLHADKGGS